jgi:hypothetical protein
MCTWLGEFNMVKDVVVPLGAAGLGGFVGYYSAMKSIREQFRLQQLGEIENAVDGIWIELDQNIKTLDEDPSWAHLAHLSDSAWNRAKPLLAELGPEVVGKLTTAYARIGIANNAIDAFISRSTMEGTAKGAVGGLSAILKAAKNALETARPDVVSRLQRRTSE